VCSGGASLVTMVQTADLRNADDPSLLGRLHGPWLGRIFLQRQVTTAVMVVVEKRSEMARQAGVIEDDDLIQALPANGSNHSFDVRALPGRARSGQHLFDSHRLDLLHKLVAEDPIAVPEQITGCGLPREGFPELVSRPLCRWMGGDCEVQNATTIMGQDQEHIQNLKANRRYG
jgi:hypothetical protein